MGMTVYLVWEWREEGGFFFYKKEFYLILIY